MKLLKKTVAFLLFAVLLLNIYQSPISATNGTHNWYIVKRGNNTPSFPKEAELISSHQGYYIDKSCIDTNKKIIYLTFDTGYENGNVSKTLDILKEYSVPAAFFILSNIIVKNTDVVKRMAEEGHLVCNHTKNHKDLSTLTDIEVEKNLATLEDLYKEKTGYTMSKYFRFPEGKYSEDRLLLCESLGYKTIFWSLAYADWDDNKQPSVDKAISCLLSNTHPGAVVLLHPTSSTNVKILPRLIEKWREWGYCFGTLDDLVKNCNI